MILDNYTSHLLPVLQENPDAFLGFLCWYSVPESVWIDHVDWMNLVAELDAPIAMRRPPKETDVFLRACTATEKQYRRLPADSFGGEGNRFHNYLIRNAGGNENYICKQIVLEEVDEQENQLGFTVVADLKFRRTTGAIELTQKTSMPNRSPRIAEAVTIYYEQKKNLLTAYAVRESLRHSLERNLFALSVRSSGSVYFVSMEFADGLAKVEALSQQIQGVTFHVLPLINDAHQRGMVQLAFEENTVGESTKILEEIIVLRDEQKTPTNKQIESWLKRFALLSERTELYTKILKETMESVQSAQDLTEHLLFSTVAEHS